MQAKVPIHIGGESEAAMRRVARMADGWMPFNCSPEDLSRHVSELDTVLGEHSRSRSEIEITVCPYFNQMTADDVTAYADAGANAVASLFLAFSPDDVPGALDALAPLIERAAAP